MNMFLPGIPTTVSWTRFENFIKFIFYDITRCNAPLRRDETLDGTRDRTGKTRAFGTTAAILFDVSKMGKNGKPNNALKHRMIDNSICSGEH